MTPRRRFGVGVALCALLSALLRLRFVFTPLSADEGGYLAIARAWAHGKRLYVDVWVDRPQGLLVLYRSWDWLTGGSTASIRILAIMLGVVAVIGTGVAVRELVSARAGVVAAALVAVLSAAPVIEGFAANGELLVGAFSCAALAVAAPDLARGRVSWRLGMAGLLAGLAFSMKQNGFDAVVAIEMALLIAWLTGALAGRVAVGALSRVLGGFASVIAALALHGLVLGWSAWWSGFAGYRLNRRSGVVGADWARLWVTARVALPVLLPITCVVVVGLIVRLAKPTRPIPLWRVEPRASVIPLWLLVSAIAFIEGGQFHRHYWVTLTFPIAALAAAATSSWRGTWQLAAVALCVTPALVSWFHVAARARDEVPVLASADSRSIIDERIARWYRSVRQPHESVYVMCASAAFYADARVDPPYPYLWEDNVIDVPGAEAKLRRLFASDSRPHYVALYQSAIACDQTGEVGATLDRLYTRAITIDGVEVLALKTPSA